MDVNSFDDGGKDVGCVTTGGEFSFSATQESTMYLASVASDTTRPSYKIAGTVDPSRMSMWSIVRFR